SAVSASACPSTGAPPAADPVRGGGPPCRAPRPRSRRGCGCRCTRPSRRGRRPSPPGRTSTAASLRRNAGSRPSRSSCRLVALRVMVVRFLAPLPAGYHALSRCVKRVDSREPGTPLPVHSSRYGPAPVRDLCFLTATALRELIRSRRASVTEVLQAHLAQIERVNPKVNAIVTLRTDEALAEAHAADAALARGEEGGPLFGLPVAHKDLVPTRGLRTTWGSPIYTDHVPEHDGLIVERIKAAGAITVGKTNTPEFGAGSQTVNEVFGRTLTR